MDTTFPCYLVTKNALGQVTAAVTTARPEDLPPGDVTVRVRYSSLNYKDALAATGHPGVVKSFPHVPGIDAAGIVETSTSPKFHPGDEVFTTGYGLGAERWGGFAGLIRVSAAHLSRLPAGLDLYQSMALGTAGLTAALAVAAIQRNGIEPDAGEIAVTGASGGVGSLSVAILAKLGYRVVAVSGKPGMSAALQQWGASSVVPREEVDEASSRPLLSSRWAGAIDTVGGNTLATLLRQSQRGACVAACGLVGGTDLQLTVYPFLLRGVTLAGIDSDQAPFALRERLWNHLATDWKPPLEVISRSIALRELPLFVREILQGQITGRVVVEI